MMTQVAKAKLSRSDVFVILGKERFHQQRKWKIDHEILCHATRFDSMENHVTLERSHEMMAWIGLMEVYLNKAKEIAAHQDTLNLDIKKLVLTEMRKATALGIACLEQHGCPDRPFVPLAEAASEGTTMNLKGAQSGRTDCTRVTMLNMLKKDHINDKDRMNTLYNVLVSLVENM